MGSITGCGELTNFCEHPQLGPQVKRLCCATCNNEVRRTLGLPPCTAHDDGQMILRSDVGVGQHMLDVLTLDCRVKMGDQLVVSPGLPNEERITVTDLSPLYSLAALVRFHRAGEVVQGGELEGPRDQAEQPRKSASF